MSPLPYMLFSAFSPCHYRIFPSSPRNRFRQIQLPALPTQKSPTQSGDIPNPVESVIFYCRSFQFAVRARTDRTMPVASPAKLDILSQLCALISFFAHSQLPPTAWINGALKYSSRFSALTPPVGAIDTGVKSSGYLYFGISLSARDDAWHNAITTTPIIPPTRVPDKNAAIFLHLSFIWNHL